MHKKRWLVSFASLLTVGMGRGAATATTTPHPSEIAPRPDGGDSVSTTVVDDVAKRLDQKKIRKIYVRRTATGWSWEFEPTVRAERPILLETSETESPQLRSLPLGQRINLGNHAQKDALLADFWQHIRNFSSVTPTEINRWRSELEDPYSFIKRNGNVFSYLVVVGKRGGQLQARAFHLDQPKPLDVPSWAELESWGTSQKPFEAIDNTYRKMATRTISEGASDLDKALIARAVESYREKQASLAEVNGLREWLAGFPEVKMQVAELLKGGQRQGIRMFIGQTSSGKVEVRALASTLISEADIPKSLVWYESEDVELYLKKLFEKAGKGQLSANVRVPREFEARWGREMKNLFNSGDKNRELLKSLAILGESPSTELEVFEWIHVRDKQPTDFSSGLIKGDEDARVIIVRAKKSSATPGSAKANGKHQTQMFRKGEDIALDVKGWQLAPLDLGAESVSTWLRNYAEGPNAKYLYVLSAEQKEIGKRFAVVDEITDWLEAAGSSLTAEITRSTSKERDATVTLTRTGKVEGNEEKLVIEVGRATAGQLDGYRFPSLDNLSGSEVGKTAMAALRKLSGMPYGRVAIKNKPR